MEDTASIDFAAADNEDNDEEHSDNHDLKGIAHTHLWSSVLLDDTKNDNADKAVTASATKAAANEDEEDTDAVEGTEDDCKVQPTELQPLSLVNDPWCLQEDVHCLKTKYV